MMRVMLAVAMAFALAGDVAARGGGTRTPEDPNTESGRECRDGMDNDNDGVMDCQDPDCAAMRMCTGAAGGGGGAAGGGGGAAGRLPPEDPNTETGRECIDGVDNDGDGTVDCADPDCARMTQLCGDPTCFTAGSVYTSARCCDTSKGPTGDSTCWGGGYDFPRCCPRTIPAGGRPGGRRPDQEADGTADCSIRGFARISTDSCPAPKPPARIPDTCPTDCATAFTAWQAACADQAAATMQEANTALGGGVDAFVALCQVAAAGGSGH